MSSITLTAGAAVLSFLIALLAGKILIPILHKIKYGQPIKDIGPVWHKKKQGTPTMGGLLFIPAVVLAGGGCLLLYNYFGQQNLLHGALAQGIGDTYLQKTRLWGGIILSLGCAFLGFVDDYIKVVKKNNNGLSARQKLIMQILLGLGFGLALYLADDTILRIPFIGEFDLGIFYIPLTAFIVVATTNAVNLTDGVDGLCGSVTLVYALFFMFISSYLGKTMGTDSVSFIAGAVAGAMLGFLVYNFFPAKVFMGDTGSMFLGGMVCTMAFGVGLPILILPAGIIYFAETLSVLIQTTYFKLTKGKRIFKMTPIHHSFEMSGWHEVKIVAVFSLVTCVGGFAAFLLVCFG